MLRSRYGIVPERQSGFVVFESAGETAAQMLCINNLKQLGLAARIYSSDNEGNYPSHIELLTNSIQAPNVLVCHSDTNRHAAATWAEFDPALHVTYAYHGASVKESDAGHVLFHCPIHGHVTLGDGSVQQGQLDSHGGSGSQVRYMIRPGTVRTGAVVTIEPESRPGQPAPAIVSELERLETEVNASKGELEHVGRNRQRVAGELGRLESELQEAQARLSAARQRHDAVMAVVPERLPGIISQDARYQRLKAEYEVAVLDDNEAELKRTGARLNQWVDKIYRPELQAEFELAQQNVRELQDRQSELENLQRDLERQRAEKENRIQSLMETHKTLSASFDQPEEGRPR
jgi:hypothetical protein